MAMISRGSNKEFFQFDWFIRSLIFPVFSFQVGEFKNRLAYVELK